MRITKERALKIKRAILDRGYSITGFCRVHHLSDRQFYSWLAGTNGYERNGIGKHFQDVTDALLADKALDVATQSHIVDVYGLPEIKQTKAQEEE